ncbi:hypothetical protein AB0X98_01090 [Rothia koreensis]|uniref:hypothetical protein n=1 Tax=Rothia koreensis TaxID=592378 RepID=UPI003F276378
MRGPHYDDYQDQSVVVTTVNNDSLSGQVTQTSRHEITLAEVELLTDQQPAKLAGVVNVRIDAIAWIQVHHQRKE